MSKPNENSTLVRRFFAGLTEYAFCGRIGVADPPLVDYLTDLLTRFTRSDRMFGMRSPTGRQLDQVTDMLAEAQARQGEARRHVHRHIGDFTLFWTGVYPEMVDRLQRSGQKDSLIDYGSLGKRAYMVASNIPIEKEVAPSPVLQRLSEEYDLCAYGLGEVRRIWEEDAGNSGPRLLLE